MEDRKKPNEQLVPAIIELRPEVNELANHQEKRDNLEQELKKYEFIVNSSQELMTLINRQYVYEAVNQSYCRAINRSRDEIVGRTAAEIWGEARFKNNIKGYLDKCLAGNSGYFEAWFPFHGQELRCYEVHYYPYVNAQHEVSHAVVVTHDITEHENTKRDLKKSLEALQEILEGTVNALASALEKRDPYTAGHQRRVADLACAVAREMGLPDQKIMVIRLAALVHDVGKIYVPSELLTKPSALSGLERGLIQTHSEAGFEILKEVKFPWPIAQIVLQHHERLDGSGYPQGLSENDILLEAKIISVADVVEAISGHRPYRPAKGLEVALDEISKHKGTFYDPAVADACLRLFREKGQKILEM